MFAVAVAVCAAGVAGCGGGSGGGNSGNAATSSAKSSSGSGGSALMIELRKTDLGRILTDGKGRTLYLFEKDTGPKSRCTSAACAGFWPPLVAKGSPKVGSGLSAGELGTTSRGGGVKQVTFAGHPLYYFSKDSAAGQTHGEGLKAFGAEWYVVSGSGKKVEEEGS
jgi:predicted lipoprotein with Yx(FWY)xxD motif